MFRCLGLEDRRAGGPGGVVVYHAAIGREAVVRPVVRLAGGLNRAAERRMGLVSVLRDARPAAPTVVGSGKAAAPAYVA